MTAERNDSQVAQLPPHELKELDYVSTRWDATIPEGLAPEECLRPDFWAHQARMLKPFDEIRARAQDGTWITYLLVLDCSRTWAKVAMLAQYTLTTPDVSLSQASEHEVKAFMEQHDVRFRGPLKWSIVRKSDGAVLAEGMNKDAAKTELERIARIQVGGQAVTRQPVAA